MQGSLNQPTQAERQVYSPEKWGEDADLIPSGQSVQETASGGPVQPPGIARARDAPLHWDKKLVVVGSPECFQGTAAGEVAGDAEAAEKKWRRQEEIAGETKWKRVGGLWTGCAWMKEKGPAATGALEEEAGVLPSCYAMDRSRGGPGPQSWGAVAATCGMPAWHAHPAACFLRALRRRSRIMPCRSHYGAAPCADALGSVGILLRAAGTALQSSKQRSSRLSIVWFAFDVVAALLIVLLGQILVSSSKY